MADGAALPAQSKRTAKRQAQPLRGPLLETWYARVDACRDGSQPVAKSVSILRRSSRTGIRIELDSVGRPLAERPNQGKEPRMVGKLELAASLVMALLGGCVTE